MRFTTDVINTFLTTVLTFVITIGTSIIIARGLGPSGQGIYALVLLFPALIMSFANLGMGRSIIYHISKGEMRLDDIIGNILCFTGIITFLSFLVGLIIIFWFSNYLFPNVPRGFLLIGLLFIPLQILFLQISSGILYGIQKIKIYNYAYTLQAGIILILTFVFIYILNTGVLGVIIANLISFIIVTILTLFYILKILKVPFKIKFNTKIFKTLFSFGIKVHIGNLMYFFRSRVDVFIINLFLNPTAVGLYAISYGMAETLWMLSQSAANVLSPKITSMNSDDKKKEFTPIISRNILFLTIVFAILLFFFSKWLIILLYSENYYNSILPLQILLIGIVSISLERILTADIIARGKPMITTYIVIITVFINIMLNIVLIPKFGINGAALASTISYFINLCMTLFVYIRISGNSFVNIIFIKRTDLGLYLRILMLIKQKVI